MNKYSGQWYLTHKNLTPWAFMPDAFSVEECDHIRKLAQSLPQETALVAAETEGGEQRDSIRQNSLRWMNSSDPEQAWIFRKCTDLVLNLNQRFYGFDLDYIEILQFTEYHTVGDFYDDHMDFAHNGIHRRKLSFSIQLTDPSTYEGSDLEIVYGRDKKEVAPRTQGTIIAFPSFQMHRVTALEKGQRESLVGWVAGPPWR